MVRFLSSLTAHSRLTIDSMTLTTMTPVEDNTLSLVMLMFSAAKLASPSGISCSGSGGVADGTSSWHLNCERATCRSEGAESEATVVRSRWQRFRDSNCFCDRLCDVYSDCCSDKERTAFGRDHVLPRDSFTCLVVDGLYSTGLPIYVVNKCPESWVDDVIRSNCEREVDFGSGIFLDWFVSDSDFILFRNYYCALCHGRTNATYWKMRLACDEIISLEDGHWSNDRAADVGKEDVRRRDVNKLAEKLKEGVCHLKYEPPDDVNRRRFVRLCKPQIDACPRDWADPCVREMCQSETSETSYVYSRSELKTYRNKYCALCNGAPDDVGCDDVIIDLLFPPLVGVMRDTSFYPLNIIFDLNPAGHPFAEYKIGTKSGVIVNRTVSRVARCPERRVYDPFLAECRPVTCRSGYVFRSGTCEKMTSANVTTIDACVMVTLNESEYVLFDNGSVLLNRSGMIYDVGNYEITASGSVAVCSNFTANFTDVNLRSVVLKFSEEQGVVSVVGQFVSVLALALTVIVYCCLPKLRNIAGKCVISLSCSLLIAQLTFLIGVSFHPFDSGSASAAICLVFAVGTHLAFLCSFAWMNVMALDVCRIFAGSVHRASAQGQRSRFIRYSVYAWCSPMVVVVAAVIVDVVAPPTSTARPGYGDGLCWITNRRALFLFFALPVALILAANLVMFVLTAVHIANVQNSTRKVTGCSDRRRYGVYVKISIVMGLTWIFAFLASATDSEVLWYFFLVFNTLQGAFIFVAFTFTKQVMAMLREKYHKVRRSLRRPSDKSTEERTLTTMTSHSVKPSSSNNVAAHRK